MYVKLFNCRRNHPCQEQERIYIWVNFSWWSRFPVELVRHLKIVSYRVRELNPCLVPCLSGGCSAMANRNGQCQDAVDVVWLWKWRWTRFDLRDDSESRCDDDEDQVTQWCCGDDVTNTLKLTQHFTSLQISFSSLLLRWRLGDL